MTLWCGLHLHLVFKILTTLRVYLLCSNVLLTRILHFFFTIFKIAFDICFLLLDMVFIHISRARHSHVSVLWLAIFCYQFDWEKNPNNELISFFLFKYIEWTSCACYFCIISSISWCKFETEMIDKYSKHHWSLFENFKQLKQKKQDSYRRFSLWLII